MPAERKSLMRSLGEFFGHVARGVRTDPRAAASGPTVVREETSEREHTSPDGRRVILRRTVVEEVEVVPDEGPGDTGEQGNPTR